MRKRLTILRRCDVGQDKVANRVDPKLDEVVARLEQLGEKESRSGPDLGPRIRGQNDPELLHLGSQLVVLCQHPRQLPRAPRSVEEDGLEELGLRPFPPRAKNQRVPRESSVLSLEGGEGRGGEGVAEDLDLYLGRKDDWVERSRRALRGGESVEPDRWSVGTYHSVGQKRKGEIESGERVVGGLETIARRISFLTSDLHPAQHTRDSSAHRRRSCARSGAVPIPAQSPRSLVDALPASSPDTTLLEGICAR